MVLHMLGIWDKLQEPESHRPNKEECNSPLSPLAIFLVPELTLGNKFTDRRCGRYGMKNGPQTFKSLLCGASSNILQSCFPAKQSLGDGRPEKSSSQTAFLLLSASRHHHDSPITNNDTKGPPTDAGMTLLHTASSRASFPVCKRVKHTKRRHLGLMGLFSFPQ